MAKFFSLFLFQAFEVIVFNFDRDQQKSTFTLKLDDGDAFCWAFLLGL